MASNGMEFVSLVLLPIKRCRDTILLRLFDEPVRKFCTPGTWGHDAQYYACKPTVIVSHSINHSTTVPLMLLLE